MDACHVLRCIYIEAWIGDANRLNNKKNIHDRYYQISNRIMLCNDFFEMQLDFTIK